MIKKRKHSKVFNMVEDELQAINKIKEMKKLLKTIKKKPKKLNCVATKKCQINFEQQ